MLVSPGPPGQRVEDDGVVIAAVVEAGVEVQGQVVGVVTDVDGEAGREAEVQRSEGCSEPSASSWKCFWNVASRVCRTHQEQPCLGFTRTINSDPSMNDKSLIFCGDRGEGHFKQRGWSAFCQSSSKSKQEGAVSAPKHVPITQRQ